MNDASGASDRYFDLSLRLLTIFVLVSLVCCVAFLTYRWVAPHLLKRPAAPVEARGPVLMSPAPAAQTAPAPADEVLMDPRKTFRCVEQGKVTFSDRACDSGSIQIIPR
ncbi:MAG TPA: hypothetical protein VMQ45_07540 [Burkholderiaceae bacterium]|nr:hypothetical protein [Burkholderiaceae bacterium]